MLPHFAVCAWKKKTKNKKPDDEWQKKNQNKNLIMINERIYNEIITEILLPINEIDNNINVWLKKTKIKKEKKKSSLTYFSKM